MAHKVYISYSSWDKPVADVVCRELEADDIACWMAPRDINPGEDWTTCISNAIEGCQVVVLILSSRSDSSRNVYQEIEKAEENGKLIIPILVEDFQPGPGLAAHIQNLHWLDAAHTPLTDAVASLSKNISQSLQFADSAVQVEQRPREKKAPDSLKSADTPDAGKTETGQFDVFISYRRATDAQTARLIRSELQRHGFRVFLDVDDLRPGHFDEALLKRIEEAHSFILILSPGSLEHCTNPEDWMRREAICALAHGKQIIPILMPNFTFPDARELPPELQPLLVHHGIKYSHEFFDAMMEKIVDYLRPK